jgi:protein CpxP
MKVKVIFTLAVMFVLAMTVNSYAQMGGNPQDRLKKTLEDFKTRLKLTDVQFGKVDTIMTDQMNQQIKLRESAGEDRQAMMSAFMELREKTNKKIEALLTDEQKAEWKKMQEERAAQRGQGMGRGQ